MARSHHRLRWSSRHGAEFHWQQFDGEIPAELRNLSNLTELSLGGNGLSGEIPAELRNLSNLTELSLGGNGLSGEIPAELRNLSNLTELSLGGNGLSGEIPAELRNLSNLTRLVLSRNRLTGPLPAELGDLTSLQELYLWGNTDLTGPLPLGLTNLNDLTTVWIQDTGLCAPKEKEYLRWQVLRKTRKFRLTSHQFNLSNKHSEAERHAQDNWSDCCFAVDCIGQCGGPG